MAAITSDDVKRLSTAVTSIDAGNRIADALNVANAFASQGPVVIAATIVATSVSQTTDFGALLTTDKVVMIPATAGNADFITPSATGNLGQAAVVGNLYLVLRAFSAPTASSVVF